MTESKPDDTIAWCGACQIEIKGYSKWMVHLESNLHQSNVEQLSKSRLVKIDHFEKKSKRGTKIAVSVLAIITVAFVFSPNLIQFVEEQIGFEIIIPNTENLTDISDEIIIDETRVVERKTKVGTNLEFNPDVIEFLVHKFTNEQRVINGLDPIKFDFEISDIARMHSIDMSDKNYFAHENLDGKDASDRARDVGYRCFKWINNSYYVGLSENIFRGNLYKSIKMLGGIPVSYEWLSNEEIAYMAVDGWMNSEGHRKNILNSHFDREGIGVHIDSEDRVYVTQNFC
ncbi:MAG TPA: CAP domain-containing protein [Nitrosopumilaceae archaeon]|nr:CAP domain-containing protein [Nitrosopumilaceae archaeon]